MKPWIRKLWKCQPLWLRRKGIYLITRLLAHRLNAARPMERGDIIIGGFLGTASGLGEGARQMTHLMRQAGLPVRTSNVSRFAVLEDFDAGALWPDDASAGGVAVMHVNPDIHNLVMKAIGWDKFNRRKLIGYWAWELDVIPDAWLETIRAVDEVWVPSTFIARAINRAAGRDVARVVALPMDVASKWTAPKKDILPQFAGRPIVFYAFDVRSTVARKNPLGVIEAFKRAVVGDPNPVLVLKVNNEKVWEGARPLLDAAIDGHPQIHVIRDVLSAEDMKNLTARVDIILSLHRSEGFGLLMAEGMAAGKPVIATGWSANLDFMPEHCTVLVPSKQIPIVDPQRAYGQYGATWADPDLDFAAAALRRLLDNPDERARMGAAARAHITAFFDPKLWIERLPASFWDCVAK